MELTGDPPSPDLIYPYSTATTATTNNKNNNIRKHTSYDDIHTGIYKIILTKHIRIVCSPVYCIKIRKTPSVTRYVCILLFTYIVYIYSIYSCIFHMHSIIYYVLYGILKSTFVYRYSSYTCVRIYTHQYAHIFIYCCCSYMHIHISICPMIYLYVYSPTASFLNNADVVEVYDKTISGFYQLVNGKVRKWLPLVY